MAEIKITRYEFQDNRTFGYFEYNGIKIHCLEDTDRGLKSDLPLAGIKELKVQNQTAIPYGRYEVGVSYSERFKKLMPIVMNVPGFSGIRVHSGNKETQTEGCPLIGLTRNPTMVLNSRDAFRPFFSWLLKTLKTEKVYLNVVKG